MSARLYGVAAALSIAATVAVTLWRRRTKATIPQVSIPEALHALAHGSSLKRVLASRAVCSIIFGEVTVLEEVLDDAAGTHAEYGAKRSDGRTLLDVAAADAGAGDVDALAFLLAITEADPSWDDEDEWNATARRAADALKALPRAVAALEALAARGDGAAAGAAAVLLERLAGADVSPATETPDGFRAGDGGLAPEPLPFNTRVHCAVCSNPAHTADGKQTFECATCRNVTYCCPEHRAQDAARHGFWCGKC
jgi:hypothetical protein